MDKSDLLHEMLSTHIAGEEEQLRDVQAEQVRIRDALQDLNGTVQQLQLQLVPVSNHTAQHRFIETLIEESQARAAKARRRQDNIDKVFTYLAGIGIVAIFGWIGRHAIDVLAAVVHAVKTR